MNLMVLYRRKAKAFFAALLDTLVQMIRSEFGRLWLLERLKSEFFMNPYTRFVAAWICSVNRQKNPSLMIF